MPKYLIERNMPGAGALSESEFAALAEKSIHALVELGTNIQWVESFITADKVYSVYIAQNEGLIREHASLSGLPADAVHEVHGRHRFFNLLASTLGGRTRHIERVGDILEFPCGACQSHLVVGRRREQFRHGRPAWLDESDSWQVASAFYRSSAGWPLR